MLNKFTVELVIVVRHTLREEYMCKIRNARRNVEYVYKYETPGDTWNMCINKKRQEKRGMCINKKRQEKRW